MLQQAKKNYLQQVLGIQSWLKPKNQLSANLQIGQNTQKNSEHQFSLEEFDGPLRPERLNQKFDMIFLHLRGCCKVNSQPGTVSEPGPSLFAEEGWELFQKMKAAMLAAVPNRHLQVLEIEVAGEFYEYAIPWIQKHLKNSALVVLRESPRNISSIENNSFAIETWSPWCLLQNPERKREAWDCLQKATRYLARSPSAPQISLRR